MAKRNEFHLETDGSGFAQEYAQAVEFAVADLLTNGPVDNVSVRAKRGFHARRGTLTASGDGFVVVDGQQIAIDTITGIYVGD